MAFVESPSTERRSRVTAPREAPTGPAFARTKIRAPRLRPASLVPRDTLSRRPVAALSQQPLVLLSAAAGYGKTTALAQALDALPPGHVAAWVSADEGDDLHRLLDCLVSALEPLDLPWRTAPEALVAQACEPATRPRAVAEFVNALDAADVPHGVIAFDDLHRVDDGAFHDFLDRVLERLGPRWTLALATRHDPPLALARLRGRGELAEFRTEDLRFGDEEAQALARLAGVAPERAEPLQRRTQGWPAGLRLALARGALVGSPSGEREMADYLAAEVIDRLPGDLRRFLLRAAVLPELTAARAAAVTGDAAAARRLHDVERLGLFSTRLDDLPPTLRLHDLFRDALLQRLQREHGDEWPCLWQRAAAGENDPARRVTMLLRAGDEAAAAEWLLRHAAGLLALGALATVVHLLDQFPGDAVARRPALQTVLGLLAWTRRDFAAMLASMRRAEAGFDREGLVDRARAAVALQALALNALGLCEESARRLDAVRRGALGPRTQVLVLQAGLWHALHLGAHDRAAPLLDELVTRLERIGDASLWYGASPPPELNGLPGTAPALQRWVDGALHLAGDRPLPLRALAQVQRGWQLAWQAGDLEGADAALAAAQDDSRWLGHPGDVQGAIALLEVHLHLLRGRRERALAVLQGLQATQPPTQGPAATWSHWHDMARIAALLDEPALLQASLARLAALPAAAPQQARLVALRGHAARLAGDPSAAIDRWRQALAQEPALQGLGQAVEVRLYLAAALAAARLPRDAASLLAPVAAALAGGAGRGALLMARGALPSLQAQGLLDPRLRAMGAPDEAAPVVPKEPPRFAGLSEREREVLERIAAGDSNKLIARAFDLSPHTVKRHVAHILDKLGVDSRGQAAAWFRRQGA